ncbi:MAG: T9SS type A sorting domain-containing protein [Flavobacteriales bacterium]|nr:T9SS type A sorting domain-containing protein [Flavobacteriales bacterium]
MKKLILSLSVLAVTGAFAQKNARILKSQDLVKTAPKTTTALQPINKIMTTLWSDDFSTPTNWTIDNDGQSGNTFGWNINATSQGWWSTTGISANGTSGGNNAELVNGNPTASPATQAIGVTYTMTTAQPIDVASLGGTNQISIQFKQFGARFNDLQEIQISTDGTTFTTVGNNLDKEVLSAAGGSPYPNPDTKLINLATVLSTAPTQLWIRFSWTSNFGGETNPNAWVTYGWYIDDVKIVTNPEYDLSINTNTWGTAGLNYYQIPTTQVAPISFSTNVFNGGLNALTAAQLKAEVFAGTTNVFTGTSAPTAVPSVDTATLTVSTSFTPPATVGNFTLKRKLILGYLPNGQILTGALTNGGSAYTTGTNISATGGSGTGATVNIVAASNGVTATGALSNAGSGYTTGTGISTTGGSGSGLTLDITASSIGEATSLTVDLYNSGTVVSETNVATTGGTGTGLTVNVTADANGDVDTITIANSGTGYSAVDYITIDGSGGPIDIIINSTIGDILTATIATAGSGYTVGDIVTIAGGTATYTVNSVSGGAITSVTLNNAGTGYTAGDVLTVNGGTGGTYTIGTVTNNTEIVDEVPTNNTIADVSFAVTNYVYARDNGAFSGNTSNGGDGFEVGNLFDIWADQELKGISVRLAGGTGGTTVGTEVYAKIYSIDQNGEFAFLEETAPLTVANNNLNTILNMVLLNPVSLSAGQTYLAVVGSFDGGLRVSNAGSSEQQTSFLFDVPTDTWFYTTSTPVVRLNFDPILSVNENTLQVADAAIYPNPTSSTSTVEFNLVNASEATISITDLSGKVVSERNLGQLNAGANATEINTTSFNAGVYYVTIASNGSSVTKKLIKN